MSLEKKLAQTLREISSCGQENSILSPDGIIPLIDLTLLDNNATRKEIHDLAMKANQNHVAAICVLPSQLDYIAQDIKITRATVINFPTGNELHSHVLKTIERTATLQLVDEIDYVFPYQAYLAGRQKEALSCCQEAFQCCKQQGLVFKVILETGALPSMDVIYDLSIAIIQSGCDFIKTSTGKIANGACIPAVFSMLSAIIDCNIPCGIKVSGGIKTVEQALAYMQLAQQMQKRKINSSWFRLGASSLLDVLIKR